MRLNKANSRRLQLIAIEIVQYYLPVTFHPRLDLVLYSLCTAIQSQSPTHHLEFVYISKLKIQPSNGEFYCLAIKPIEE